MNELPAWWSAPAEKRKQNRRSKHQERERAQQTGGRQQPGSGSSYRAPQDVITPLNDEEEGFVESIKYTDANGYRITVAEWERLRSDARNAGREPRLIIDFPQRKLRLVVSEEDYPRRGA